MSQQNCYLCGSNKYIIRPGVVRDNPEIKVLECVDCELVYLSSFKHIDVNHYEESGIHDGNKPDIELWLKETQDDDLRRYQFVKNKLINKNVMDFGCGIGGFLNHAKLLANKAVGIELEKALQPSFKERGLMVYPSLQSAQSCGEKWDLITSFHVIEHLSNPREMLVELSKLLGLDGEIIIEVPNSDDALLTLYENKEFQNFTYWSQHLFLFNAKTLSELIKQANLKVKWIKHVQRYSLSNHLYWMSKGAPGGHKKWCHMNNDRLDSEYESMLAANGKTDTITACISLL